MDTKPAELTGIGPWKLVEVLGEGERATVYRGVHEGAPSSEAIAVKVLHAALAADPVATQAFVARGRVGLELARLEHPAIVPVREVVPGPRPYVVMDLVDGLALERLVPERGRAKLALEAATNIVIAIGDALSAAANAKRVHGRLGPSDVLVTADGLVLLTSLGAEDDRRADFLPVHGLTQALSSAWPPEVDAWLDRLADAETPWRDMRQARAAFPLAFTDLGQAALQRLVKNRRKKDEKARLAAQAESEGEAAASEPTPEPSERRKARTPRPATKPRARPSPEDAENAIRQARVVAIAAAALLALAFVLELTGSGR